MFCSRVYPSAGDVLNVVVGQMGSDDSSTNGGAGGGLFWLDSTGLSGQPLTVAGGGGMLQFW